MLAHMNAYSAPKASVWKSTVPTSKILQLADPQYRMAARLNLRLQPFACMNDLPASCTLCKGKYAEKAIEKDSWHFLTCSSRTKREQFIRHNAIVDALYHSVLLVGGQAMREPMGLSVDNKRRPDLQIVFPGEHILTDVVVVHPLTHSKTAVSTNAIFHSRRAETAKLRKYNEVADTHQAQLLPFAVETSGGLAPGAITLLDIISRTGQEHLALWSRNEVEKYVMGAVSMSVQRGTAMAMLNGYMGTLIHSSGKEESE
jgi:hypothetical protein